MRTILRSTLRDVEEPMAAPEPSERVATADAKGDSAARRGATGHPLSNALRLPLLPLERERHLARSIWDARRRLVRLLRFTAEDDALPVNDAPKKRGETPLTRTERNALIEAELRARALVSRHGVSSELVASLNPSLQRIAAAREVLLAHNLRLVVWAAGPYQGRGLDFADLVQEGAMGLLHAIDRFDPAVGTRLGTFATVVIRHQILRALGEKSRLIRLPLRKIQDVVELEEARAELGRSLGRAPAVEEIAEAAGVETSSAESLLTAATPALSLETTMVSEGRTLADALPNLRVRSPFHAAVDRERVRAVANLLGRLDERSATILSLRFGFVGGHERTLEEIGTRLGVSRERVRQLEKEALMALEKLILDENPALLIA